MTVVPSDKSNRLCVTKTYDLVERTNSILKDESTYKVLNKSKKKSLEKQANKLVSSVLKDKVSKSNLQRMLVSGSQPAQFYTMIKDHKEKNENNQYPLRPIASCINNPTNKIDWFCGRILNQLVNFVPAHLPSSLKLIEELSKSEFPNTEEDFLFISLDVINLYPSLPIDSALKVTSEFSNKYWKDIDNFEVFMSLRC